jgi:hypothetical protein
VLEHVEMAAYYQKVVRFGSWVCVVILRYLPDCEAERFKALLAGAVKNL